MKKEELAGIMLLDDAGYSHSQSLKDAYDYFDVISNTSSDALGDVHFNGANKVGMVDLVCLTNNEAKLTVTDLELTAVMESLSNILVATVIKKSGGDEKKLVDGTLWEEGFNALIRLFCSDYSRNVIHYNDKVIGPEAVKEIMAIAFDVYGEPEGKLRDDITGYLQKQGNLMDKMGYDGKINNPYTLIGFSNFIKDGKHRCCFTAYFTTFGVNTVKISRTCKDPKKEFDFDFQVTHCNSNFMVTRWEIDPAFRLKVKDFIDRHQPGEDYFDTWETGDKINDVPSK